MVLARKIQEFDPLDLIIDLTKFATELQDKSNNSEFEVLDIRKCTFGKFMRRVDTHLFNFAQLNAFIRSAPDTPDLQNEETERMLEHVNKQNRLDFFTGVYGLFEDAITRILKAYLSPEEYEKFFPPTVLESLDLEPAELRYVEQNPGLLQKLSVRERHSSLIAKMRKMKTLTNLTKDDVTFSAVFCSKLRNVIHSNDYYFGEEYLYEEDGQSYHFVDGEGANFMFHGNVVRWVIRLVEIFEKIVAAIDKDKIAFIHDDATSYGMLPIETVSENQSI